MSIHIPKVFHRIWLGEAEMPPAHKRFGQTWLDLHPGWEMVTWTEANLPRLRNTEAWNRATSFSLMSDLARHEILSLHGGIYIDTDFECLRNIGPLLAEADLVSGWQDSRAVAPAFLASVPGHRVLEEMIARMPARIEHYPDADNSFLTGPGLFTQVITPYACEDARIVLLEPYVLYPYHWTEPHRASGPFPEAYAAHHWAKSW